MECQLRSIRFSLSKYIRMDQWKHVEQVFMDQFTHPEPTLWSLHNLLGIYRFNCFVDKLVYYFQLDWYDRWVMNSGLTWLFEPGSNNSDCSNKICFLDQWKHVEHVFMDQFAHPGRLFDLCITHWVYRFNCFVGRNWLIASNWTGMVDGLRILAWPGCLSMGPITVTATIKYTSWWNYKISCSC